MSERSTSGLRERKKARTRALIQREALRLFREQGYAATTVEQIAEAAEVAPSTVFRYFPTKEDLVLMDHFPPFVAALRAAPPELGPVEAVRAAMRETLAAQTPEEIAEGFEREKLMLTVPELWAASLRGVTGVVAALEEIFAERAGRRRGDPEIRNVTGAIMGVILAMWFDWVKDPSMDAPAELDHALAHLQAGLPLT
ncbi:TetR/AcrR family transcriptional regulator [Bailinhaonella thermotolerans]|uniref:TetR family transcriptional regulator n=1 Tax=Bailinhaonella thermotolerans TaxID=1070861 RepID=A0A3A4A984_9ACTN|nr:TetR family transcriptional regulator [Bailinhaonella thermotolerans]RJL22844.1 TetR family transcriptional regulator [Bailinhaonella thermotolerans]